MVVVGWQWFQFSQGPSTFLLYRQHDPTKYKKEHKKYTSSNSKKYETVCTPFKYHLDSQYGLWPTDILSSDQSGIIGIYE